MRNATWSTGERLARARVEDVIEFLYFFLNFAMLVAAVSNKIYFAKEHDKFRRDVTTFSRKQQTLSNGVFQPFTKFQKDRQLPRISRSQDLTATFATNHPPPPVQPAEIAGR